MPRPLQILVLLLVLVLVLEGRAQTFVEGDYQLNRKKATAGFEVAELLAGSNITITWNNTAKTATLAGNPGTITNFAATDSTGIDFTVTNPTTTPTLSLALTKAAVGLSNVENTALSTWSGSTAITTLGTITTGTWNGSIIAPAYLGTGTSITTKYLRGDGTWQTIAAGGTWGSITGTLASQTDLQTALDAKLNSDGDGSALTGITAAQVGAIAGGDSNVTLTFGNSSLRILDLAGDHFVLLNLDEDLTAERTLKLKVNDADRYIDLLGNLIVSDWASVSGTNTGDVSLAGPGTYLSISGQTLTRSLINLGSHVTGTLPVANGGTSATTLTANAVLLGNGTSALQTVAPSTSGNVLTSNGTTWTSAAPSGATYATDLQARQGLSTNTAIAPATLWSALHESLYIADFSRLVATTSTGSGSVTTTGSTPGPLTGATANSTARGYWITQAKSGSSSWGTVDFSRPSAFGLTITVGSGSATSTGIYRVWIGTDTNASSIAARGYGFEVRHHRIWIITHNGTTLATQDTGTDISSTAFVLNVLRCVNDGAGNISVFLNNAQIGTALAGGPTTAGTGTLNILNLNGANAAANDIRTLAGTFTANVY